MGQVLREKLGLMTDEELASVLEVSVETLREWRRLRQGPDYVRAGKAVMYRAADVVAWAEKNTVAVERTFR